VLRYVGTPRAGRGGVGKWPVLSDILSLCRSGVHVPPGARVTSAQQSPTLAYFVLSRGSYAELDQRWLIIGPESGVL
ncbi:MAG: hypothetical protein LBN10_07395, partial [Propionibacteriaceae bacterium]|nr:hypothetical protein [Propionibacteriaceae bacterium]